MGTQTKATQLKTTFTLALLLVGGWTAAYGQAPVINSFSQNGGLVCTNLEPGTVASVEWAPAVTGPWTNNWAGLDAVTVDSNGTIQVSVPMFYRVRRIAAAPAGMALIPAGSFTMGDTFSEGGTRERPTHTVVVSAFYMDKCEVTKALWDEVYQWAINRPVEVRYSFEYGVGEEANNHPAYTMTWYDAVKWCNARSEKEGRTPAYYTSAAQTTVYRSGQVNVQNDWVKWNSGYRLPTEAEWEKAARGGSSGQRFPWGNTISHSQANYNSDGSPAYDTSTTRGFHPTCVTAGYPYISPVGYFAANGYGLHDMAGNVWEWCWDWYQSNWYSQLGATQNDTRGPTGPLSDRVVRGGGWLDSASNSRCATRSYGSPDVWYNWNGFRCVRGL